jgi:hypothetical protein
MDNKDELTPEEFMRESGLSQFEFDHGKKYKLFPFLENGNLDFRGDWYDFNKRMDVLVAESDRKWKAELLLIRSQVEKDIPRLAEPRTITMSSPVIKNDGEFLSAEARRAFERNSGNIRIKGQKIGSQSSQEWWATEGFLSEAAALAFKKADANGHARIFNRK